jgi:4-amino-4-deoxy-L-arabinose transferase-like glycosyltransferase
LKKIVFAFVCLFLLGAGLRAVYVWRPVDRPSWREADVAAIARNYYREGMNPFYPRIDWRGDGPGYAEMEFPLFPWSIAVLYKLFGVHEVFGRLLSYLFSLLSLLVFFKLARYLLPPIGAFIASLFFVLSPVVISISNSLQPDGLMLLWYLTAVYALIRWLDDESAKYFLFAMIATALAILAKANAAHLGILFAILILQRQGFSAVWKWRNWVFGAVALLPGLLWYRHAHQLWLTYGNSLGVSNETHWAGLDLFTNSSFIRGILANEIAYVWMPTGILILLIGFVIKPRARVWFIGVAWLASVFIFFLVAARTTGDSWAFYYHAVAVAPFALLVGQAIEGARNLSFGSNQVRWAGILLAALAVLVVGGYALGALAGHRGLVVKVLVVLLLTLLLLLLLFSTNRTGEGASHASRAFAFVAVVVMVALLSCTYLYQIREDRQDFATRDEFDLPHCAATFAPLVPAGNLILASGGPCVDPTGYRVAFNSSYMFYWMDRKGFNVCVEAQSVPAVEAFAQRGARFFVAEKSALIQRPGFESELRQKYPVLRECDVAVLFALRPTTP